MGSHFNHVKLWSILFFLFWLLLLGGSYWYFLVKPQQWFDLEMQQPPRLADPLSQSALRQILTRHFPKLDPAKNWFIRFRQPDCGCERFVELYHKSYANNAPKNIQVRSLDITSEKISLEERHQLTQLIPSTPSVLIFQGLGSVVYFGPYHQEGICSEENSYLVPVLESLQQGQPITVLNTLVFGCFCSTASH